MTKTVDEAIQELKAEIAKLEADARSKKEKVNTLCEVIGLPPVYQLAEAVTHGPIRSDQFYGQPLASSVRTILEMRQAANLGAASIGEIYSALTDGGYEFDTKNDEVARKSLRNSLVKNTPIFHKLPNGRFGLRAWYPKVRDQRAREESSADEAEDTAAASPAAELFGEGKKKEDRE